MTWEAPVIWPGATVFVVGGGPSISQIDLQQLKGRRVIGCNNVYTLMPWMDVLYFMDLVWYRWHRNKLLDFKGIKVTICRNLPEDASIRVMKRGEKFGLDLRPGYLSPGSNSGYGGIALAIKLGAQQVVLLGFDMTFGKDGQANYHNDHKRTMKADIYKNTYLKGFSSMIPHLGFQGVQVFNATEGTILDCFPKRPLEDFL